MCSDAWESENWYREHIKKCKMFLIIFPSVEVKNKSSIVENWVQSLRLRVCDFMKSPRCLSLVINWSAEKRIYLFFQDIRRYMRDKWFRIVTFHETNDRMFVLPIFRNESCTYTWLLYPGIGAVLSVRHRIVVAEWREKLFRTWKKNKKKKNEFPLRRTRTFCGSLSSEFGGRSLVSAPHCMAIIDIPLDSNEKSYGKINFHVHSSSHRRAAVPTRIVKTKITSRFIDKALWNNITPGVYERAPNRRHHSSGTHTDRFTGPSRFASARRR